MNPLVLYLVLLKATLTTFSGLASLPVLQADLVHHYHLLTQHQLDVSIVVTRSTPGPVGLYIVSAGYFAGGVAGAIAGWAAMITPAMGAVVLLRAVGRRAEHPRAKSVVQAVILASAGLLWAAAVPIGRSTITDPLLVAILTFSVAILLTRRVETLWVIFGSALVYLTAASLHLVAGL
jgi:chromate transporter